MTPTQKAVARSPLHHWHVQHGAQMVERDGWLVPTAQGVSAGKLQLADRSATAKVRLRGPGVAEFCHRTLAGTAVCQPRGVAELSGGVLACRVRDDHLLLLAAGPRLSVQLGDVDVQATALTCDFRGPPDKLIVSNAASTYAGFALTGNAIDELLRQLTALDVGAVLPGGTCAQTNLAGVTALLIRPPASRGHELFVYVAADVGLFVWETMHTTG